MKNHGVFDVFRRWSRTIGVLTCKNLSVFELFGGLRVKNPSVFEVFTTYFLGGAQRAPKINFGELWGRFESPLGSPFGHVGGAVPLLGHLLGSKWSQKRQHEGLKSDLGSSRGGQGVSKALNGSIWGRCSSLFVCYSVFWYVFVVRMVSVHAVWYLDLDY